MTKTISNLVPKLSMLMAIMVVRALLAPSGLMLTLLELVILTSVGVVPPGWSLLAESVTSFYNEAVEDVPTATRLTLKRWMEFSPSP